MSVASDWFQGEETHSPGVSAQRSAIVPAARDRDPRRGDRQASLAQIRKEQGEWLDTQSAGRDGGIPRVEDPIDRLAFFPRPSCLDAFQALTFARLPVALLFCASLFIPQAVA